MQEIEKLEFKDCPDYESLYKYLQSSLLSLQKDSQEVSFEIE